MPASIEKKAPAAKAKRTTVASERSPAAKRLAKARARDDLEAPTPSEILEFQLGFLRRSNLLVYTEDPAVILAARSTPPEEGEKVASYLERAFGSRKADVVFAQFRVPDGRWPMRAVVEENAGREMKSLLALSRRKEKDAVTETRAEAHETAKKRLKRERVRAKEQQAADRQRLSQFPADWLEYRANERQEINERAGGTTVHDERVTNKLNEIAQLARSLAEADGNDGAQIDLVVDKLIAAYDTMAKHERETCEQNKQLEVKLAAAQRGA